MKKCNIVWTMAIGIILILSTSLSAKVPKNDPNGGRLIVATSAVLIMPLWIPGVGVVIIE